MIFALFGAMAPVGAYLGVTFGAQLTQLAWWPWMFFVASIVCGLPSTPHNFVLTALSSPPMRISFKEKLQDVD
jgi:MFS family permease